MRLLPSSKLPFLGFQRLGEMNGGVVASSRTCNPGIWFDERELNGEGDVQKRIVMSHSGQGEPTVVSMRYSCT